METQAYGRLLRLINPYMELANLRNNLNSINRQHYEGFVYEVAIKGYCRLRETLF